MDKNSPVDIDLHLHTNYTDGLESPAKLLKAAADLGLKTVALTEHSDKNPSYDWYEYRDVCLANKPEGLNLLIGVEAKVLNDTGELNAPDDVLSKSDIVLGSVHGKGDVMWLLKSSCDIIAHPQITDDNLSAFKTTDKILEINPKPQYALDMDILSELVEAGRTFSFGSNTHQISDLAEGRAYFENILRLYPTIRVIGVTEPLPDFTLNR